MQKRDFSNRKYFPGTHDNSFDGLIHAVDALQKLPAPFFAAMLFLIAWAAARFQWQPALLGWLFMAGDWILLALLPRFGKSYGPEAPPAFALAILRAPFMLLPPAVWLPLQVLGTLLVIYGFWIEPHQLTLTHQTLRSPKLKSGAPIRVLHLGDLHVERITDRERHLIERVGSLNADLILFSGDFLNLSYLRDPRAWEACRWVLRQLDAPLGVYAVSGSPAVDDADVLPRLMQGTSIRWLRDESVTLRSSAGPIDLVGLTCTHKPFVDGPKLASVLAQSFPHRVERDREGQGGGHFTLLLYHTPDLAPEAAEAGIDLQLSGHTHGGQVRVPGYGAIFAGSLYGKAFESGRRQVGEMTLYVTRGIGMEGAGAPRVRFLCPPEIILWEIDGREG